MFGAKIAQEAHTHPAVIVFSKVGVEVRRLPGAMWMPVCNTDDGNGWWLGTILLACSPVSKKKKSFAGIRPGSGWDPWLEARTSDAGDSEVNTACPCMQGLAGHGTNAMDAGHFKETNLGSEPRKCEVCCKQQ